MRLGYIPVFGRGHLKIIGLKSSPANCFSFSFTSKTLKCFHIFECVCLFGSTDFNYQIK